MSIMSTLSRLAIWLCCLLATTCWAGCAYVYDPVNGNICVDQTSVAAGTVLNVTVQSPQNQQFVDDFRVYQNFAPYGWVASYTINMSPLAPGTPYTFTIDTLNFQPGDYSLLTFAAGSSGNPVSPIVTILPPSQTVPNAIRNHMINNNLAFGLYDSQGALVAAAGNGGSPPLSRGTVYTAAVNLTNVGAFNNTLSLDYYDGTGNTLLYPRLLALRTVRTAGFDQAMQVNPSCTGTPVDLSAFPKGIATITFRTPPHLKYYSNSGVLRLNFNSATTAQNCPLSAKVIKTLLGDGAAAEPIPDWTGADPVRTINVQVVRFGDQKLTTPQELSSYAQTVKDNFRIATKNYFALNVIGIRSFSLVQPAINQQKVTNWYNALPKTPGKAVLNLSNPDELYLATLLYYYDVNSPESTLEGDMEAAYREGSNGEDITLYLNDAGEPLGQGMGAYAAHIKVLRLYPGDVFFTRTTPKTYHFDPAVCAFCGANASQIIQYLANEGNSTVVANVTLHELGHIAWLADANVSTGDQSTQYFPYVSSPVYTDDSLGYFTRYEYMSYGRNRASLQGMSYGDAYLERILSQYLDCSGNYTGCYLVR